MLPLCDSARGSGATHGSIEQGSVKTASKPAAISRFLFGKYRYAIKIYPKWRRSC